MRSEQEIKEEIKHCEDAIKINKKAGMLSYVEAQAHWKRALEWVLGDEQK